MLDELLGLVVLNVIFLCSGAGVLLLCGWSNGWGLRGWVGLSYLTGVAWSGVLGGLLLESGLSLGRSDIVLGASAPLVLAVILRRFREPSRPRPMAGSLVARWAAVPAVLIATGITLVRAVAQPLDSWDAWAFWTPKAESIIYFHGLSGAYFRSGVPNADYPPLMPALESDAFRFMGQLDTTLVHIQYALLFIAFIAALAELLHAVDRYKLAAILILIAAAPGMTTQTVSAYADVPIAIFASLGALLLWSAVQERSLGIYALAGLFLAATLATKSEGAIYAAAIALSLLCISRGARLRIVGVFVAAAALSIVPWRVWTATNHVHGAWGFRASYLFERLGRFPRAFVFLAHVFASTAAWLLLPWVVLAAIIIGLMYEHRSEALFVLGMLAFSTLALDVVYWGSTYPFHWYLETSASRVITTPALIGASFTPLLISRSNNPRAPAPAGE